MFIELIRLQFLKSIRSTSFARSLGGAILIGFVTLILLSYVLGAGLILETIIGYLAPNQDPLFVLNSYLIYFFLAEFIYRYFLQKLPVVDLESLLHLPLGKAKIIHSLLLRTFISPLTIIALLLFLPFTLGVIAGKYGDESAFFWLGSILLASWTIHWVILWFKQRFEDSLIGIVVVFVVLLLGASSSYAGWFNLGELTRPVFEFAMQSPFPILVLTGSMVASYLLAHRFYVSNAYLEDLSQEENIQLANQSVGFLGRFGLPGELANLELKLILRHKKSKTILMLSGFFLLYGLIFYTNPAYQSEDGGISPIFIFVGIFITGIFSIQYGQQFLSWNSSNFDFFLSRRLGIESLVRGKYLLLASISVLCFIASVPYVYFGVDILLVHIATFLFNVGVMLHLIIYWSLWKPKPMDINKGAMFNYEGIGAAQFLIIIPMMGGPYLVYLPFSLLLGDYAGLLALGIAGIAGILGFNKLSQININKIKSNRYKISSSFRQEL
jgi:hypothetical protein